MSDTVSENPLADVFAKHNDVNYLFPRDLQTTPTKFRRFLVIGSCMAEIYNHTQPFACESDFIFANNFSGLSQQPPRPITDYDFQFIQIPLRFILPETAVWGTGLSDEADYKEFFAECCDRISLQLNGMLEWQKQSNILTFVSNFLVPVQNPMGRTLPRYHLSNPAFFIEKLNFYLAGELAKHDNVHLLDVDQISASIGRSRVQEDPIGWISHGGFFPFIPANAARIEPSSSSLDYYIQKTDDFRQAVWYEIEFMYRTIRQIDQVKLLVIDLDDTLWSGVIGEQDDVGPHLVENEIWPMGMSEALSFLKKRGVLLAIVSKNDEGRIRSIWEKVVGNKLPFDSFAAVRINWNPKVQNVSSILATVNLLPHNVVFVDDNPVERAAIKAAFPDIRVLNGHHFYWKRTLLWSAETQVTGVTEESARRTEMVRAQAVRESSRSSSSREDFLASLDLKIRLFCVGVTEDPKFARAFELLNKTNQFNTTGRRWTREEIVSACRDGLQIMAFEADDKYSVYGLVGVVLISGETIEQFVMSCRTAGLGAERAVLSTLCDLLRGQGNRRLQGRLVATPANQLCRNLYEHAGFCQDGEIWMLPEGVSVLGPTHVALTRAA